MQVQQKATHIQSFGGLNFINEYLRGIGFEKTVTQQLGSRNIYAKYSYGDLLKQLFFVSLMGGDALDDSNVLKTQLSGHPALPIASPDTIEYAFQELQQPVRTVAGTKDVAHQLNEHKAFNGLLALLCGKTGLLAHTQSHTLDYDGHIIENTKHDNAFTYKRTKGYYPVVCSVNKLPVYMQNRNGNTPESYNQKEIIETAIANCRHNNIPVNAFRADACCYQKDTVQYLEAQNITYYIRAENCLRLTDALCDEPDWQPAMLGFRNVETCSIEAKIFGQGQYRRIVAYRYKQIGQLSIGDMDGHRYYAIVTSDKDHAPLECIGIYNQRGCDGEHHFKELDHDFNWNKLPFDNMEMNTIYLYAMAVAYVLFNAVKTAYAQKLSFVTPQMRLKNFILHFVALPAKWIKSARQQILKIFTTKDYSPLWSP